MKDDLNPEFLSKANSLLGKYLDTKKEFHKEGYEPEECFNVDKLRLIENVPMMPRCFRSIIPNKPKKKRTTSAVPFGRSLPKTPNNPQNFAINTVATTSKQEKPVEESPHKPAVLSTDKTNLVENLYGKFIDKLKQLKDEGFNPTEWFDAEML